MNPTRLTSLLLTLVLAVTVVAVPATRLQTPRSQQARSRAGAPAGVEQKINQLLARMTLAEKLGQLQQLDGHADGRYKDEQPGLVRNGLLGSTLNVRGVRNTNELQRIAIEESRLKIPLLFGFDVIHGYRTIFPIPLGEAATWDPAAVEHNAAIAAKESRASGVHWTFAPMVDIARDARWGRIAEGSGEDPFLGSVMARARVLGFQGSDYSAADKVVACAKHWVAYGAAEGGRDYNTTDLSERTLREVYFPPFRAAARRWCRDIHERLQRLERGANFRQSVHANHGIEREWKFDGIMVSDYESVKELINHGLAANEKEAAEAGLNAGVDMEMVSRLYNKHGADLLKERKLTLASIDEAVRRVLRIKFRLGLFEKPYADEARERTSVFTQNISPRPAKLRLVHWCC